MKSGAVQVKTQSQYLDGCHQLSFPSPGFHHVFGSELQTPRLSHCNHLSITIKLHPLSHRSNNKGDWVITTIDGHSPIVNVGITKWMPKASLMATILIVDDRQPNREYLVALLGASGHRLLEASDGVMALQLARQHLPDLMITDILMPNMDGFALAREWRADADLSCIPVIFCTAAYLEGETRKLARACGVHQVLIKPMVPEAVLLAVETALAKPIGHSVPTMTDSYMQEHLHLLTNKLYEKVEELEATNAKLENRTRRLAQANIRLQNLSLTDTLTKLYNRRGFLQFATKHLKLIQRIPRRACLLFVDIDNMKHINDHFGHQVGDRALVQVADTLRRTFRGSDVVGRIGGDEFAVLAIGNADTSDLIIQSRMHTHLDDYNRGVTEKHRLALSLGSAWIEPDDHRTIETVLTDADGAMYIQKQSKKRQVMSS